MKKSLLLLGLACGSLLPHGCGGGSTPPPPPPVATQLSVTASSISVTAGTAFNITVSALDASGAAVSNYSGTVHFTSSDAQAVLPKDTTLTNGTGSGQVTFKTAGSQIITASDVAKILTSGASSPINVGPGAATQLSVSLPATAATVSLPFNFSVSAFDAYGNAATGYMDTVQLTCNDPQAAFQPSSSAKLTNGSGAFSAIFKTISSQTIITATDVANASLTAKSGTINVVSNAATQLSISGPSSVGTRATFSFTVTPLDGAGNASAGYSGTVHFASSDGQAILPSNGTVTAPSTSFSATMESAGAQMITATDTNAASISGKTSITVTNTPDPTISSSNPPNGKIGVNYGPSNTQYFLCVFSHIRGPHWVCNPCSPRNGTCGSHPPCNGSTYNSPCIETQHIFAGFKFTATAGVPPFSWNASGMPAGLQVDAPTGEILGTPTTPGANNISVSVTDSGRPSRQTSMNYGISIALPDKPVVNTTPPSAPGVVNQPYSYTFTASGYQPSTFTWSESGPLPNGLTLDSHTGVLSGTPTVANSYPITVTATDQFQQTSAGANFTILITQHGFVATGSMATPRVAHTATLLCDLSASSCANNQVLVAGGTDATGTAVATAELYDPSTGSFSPSGSMATARHHFAATLLPSGKVLVTGGLDVSGNPLSSAEIYDPGTKTFSATSGSMQFVHASHTATLLNTGKVLIAGWGNATAELFDPATGTFTATGSMVMARVGHTATLLQSGKVLLTGGIQGAPPNTTTLAEAELYDPTAGTFSKTAGNLVTARQVHAASLLSDGKVLVTGGLDSTGTAIATAEVFDPTSQSFTATTGNLATARAFHTSTALADGTVLVTGGSNGTTPLAVAELYDSKTETFSPTGSMQTACTSHTATRLKDGRVLVTGGLDTNAIATAELYQ